MTDQTVPSLTDRLAAYMVEAFLDGRGYDPGDKIDVTVTLNEGFCTGLRLLVNPTRGSDALTTTRSARARTATRATTRTRRRPRR